MIDAWLEDRQVVAHRGSRLLWPENTMHAFEAAVELGVSLIETDVRVSADGVLFCFHDRDLDRTTDSSGPFLARSSADLQTVDAGYRHSANEGFPFRGKGIGIPTLESVLDALPELGVVIDLKAEGTEAALSDLVARRPKLRDRLVVGSFSSHRLTRFRTLTDGKVATSTGPAETLAVLAAVRSGSNRNPFGTATRALQLPVSWYGLEVVTKGLVDLAHRFERIVQVWTINEPGEMQRLWRMGVDGVITDRPDRAIALR